MTHAAEVRVGYVIVPPDLIEPFYAPRDATDIFPATLFQAVLADFIGQGHFGRHIRRMRALYASRCNLLAEALRTQMGELLEVVNAEAGMHLVALLPKGVSDRLISRRASEQGISAMPLSRCYLGNSIREGLVLGYGAADDSQILHGVRKLKSIVESAMNGRVSSSRSRPR